MRKELLLLALAILGFALMAQPQSTAVKGGRTFSGAISGPGISNVRSINYIGGADNAASVLDDADDQATIFRNNIAAMTITEVWCESDAGTPSINLQRDDGTAADILSSNLTCTTSGATGTIDTAEDNLAVGDKIDFVVVTAGGVAKRVTVAVKMTVD